jgi:hypothetical protein
MTCPDVEGLIIAYASGAAIPPEAATHIAGCERCRRLARAIAETHQGTPPSPDRLREIKAGILADLKPVKPLAPAGGFFFALMVILLGVAAVGRATLGIAGWRALSPSLRIFVFTALAAAAGLLAFSLVRQMAPASRLLPSPYLLVIMVLGIIASLFGTLFQPHEESTFVATGLVCLKIGLTCAISAALLYWLVLRRGAILNPILTAVTAGALAGSSGLTVLEIFCPNLNEYHILVWHLGAALLSATGGLAIGFIAELSRPRRTGRIP